MWRYESEEVVSRSDELRRWADNLIIDSRFANRHFTAQEMRHAAHQLECLTKEVQKLREENAQQSHVIDVLTADLRHAQQ